MTDGGRSETAYEHMGRRWLGLGNLKSPCWFVGLEPGGTPPADWPERWEATFGAPEVMDGRADDQDPDTARFFGPVARLQKTWAPLIRLRLDYANKPTDDASCLAYQRNSFVRADGDEALLELSGYPASNTGISTPRSEYTVPRVERMRELMALYQPEIVVCYGLSHRWDFEYLCGGPFSELDGFRWSGSTLCALTAHPQARFGKAPGSNYWPELGLKMRNQVISKRGRS
jgi:hypothetical protein